MCFGVCFWGSEPTAKKEFNILAASKKIELVSGNGPHSAQTHLKSSLVTSLPLLNSFMCFLFYLMTFSTIRSDEIIYALGSREGLNSENS